MVGQVFFAGEESDEWTALPGDLVANRPAQDRIAGLERVENGARAWLDSPLRAAPHRPRAPACANDKGAPLVSWQRLHFDRQHGRKIPDDRIPRVAAVGRCVNLPAGGAKINAARVERVNGHGVAQHVDIAVPLRQTVCQRFPFVSARPAAVHPQLSVGREMFRVALDGDDIDGFRFVRVNIDRESEIGRQIAADLVPGFPGVVAAHDIPVLLHEQHFRTGRMHGDPMDAVPDFRIRIGNFVRGFQPAIRRLPGLTGVIRPEYARRRDRDEDPFGPARIQNDGVQPHAARARLPEMTLGAAHSGKFLPGAAAIRRLEQGRVLRSGVNGVRVGQARVQDARCA